MTRAFRLNRLRGSNGHPAARPRHPASRLHNTGAGHEHAVALVAHGRREQLAEGAGRYESAARSARASSSALPTWKFATKTPSSDNAVAIPSAKARSQNGRGTLFVSS